jgi:DNA-binding NarL/FixJ family response regulator
MIRVLIAHDRRETLQRLVEAIGGVSTAQVVGQAHDTFSAMKLAIELQPTVVIAHAFLPQLSAFGLARLLQANVPKAQLIAVARRCHPAMGEVLAMRGSMLLNDDAFDRLPDILRRLPDGERASSP